MKLLKILVLSLGILIMLDSCSSAKTKRGCDGHRKSRVPFGYM